MATPDQANQVLNNPAFKEAYDVIAKDLLDLILTASTPDDVWMAKLRYDALQSVFWDLERQLQGNTRDGDTTRKDSRDVIRAARGTGTGTGTGKRRRRTG